MRAWRVFLGVGGALIASACSGGESPPPPPPPTTAAIGETAAEPPPTTTESEAPPIEEPTTPTAPTAPLPPRVPRTLALTYSGGCAIHETRVSCWGDSPREALDEDLTARPEVQLTGDYVDVAASDYLACARRADAPAVCFGDATEIADAYRLLREEDDDDYEEDDDGESEEEAALAIAQSVFATSTDLAMGSAGACLVRSSPTASAPNGTDVACVGDGFPPRALEGVRGTEGVVELCVGAAFACGRRSDGHVLCWGENTEGQLGDGIEGERADSATEVRALDDVLHVACGDAHACALRSDASVWCWGENDAGQLGQPLDVEIAREPRRVEGLTDARALALGPGASCATFDSGPPRCWGDNDTGQLGDGSTHSSATPIAATAVGEVRELALGGAHGCAVRGDEASREIVCWGLGADGALGPRARRRSYEPVEPFAGLAGITRVIAGTGSICVRVGDEASGEVRCVGSLGADPLGGVEARRRARVVPRADVEAAVSTMAPLLGAAPSRLAITTHSRCTLTAGHLACVPSTSAESAPVTLEDVIDVRSTSARICALHRDGALSCATDASSTTLLSFVPATHLPPARALTVTYGGACVVTREGGNIVCEGPIQSRQPRLEPYPLLPEDQDAGPPAPAVPGAIRTYRYREVSDVVQLSSAGGGLVARFTDGRVVRLDPTQPPAQLLDRADTILDGSGFACARRIADQGGEVWCWGQTTRGQLARDTATPTTVLVPGLAMPLAEVVPDAPPIDLATHAVIELSVTGANACARLSDARVLCWGDDREGQLGRAPAELRLRPVVVLD